MSTTGTRNWWRLAQFGAVTLVIAGVVAWLAIRRWIPAGMMQDVRAGLTAREIKDPDERLHQYLTRRYGPQDDPANRQKVFLDFFNLEHIKVLQLMVKHGPPEQRQANIQAMSRWVEQYRNSLKPEERQALSAQFQTAEGRAMLRQATAQYNSQDVRYRGMTAPVISQLLNTLKTVQQP